MLTEYDTARSEALFADAVLLVEGKADLIAARGTAVRLGVELDARNLTVMECGGKSSIPFHARLCRALGIPVCALYADDQWPVPDGADEALRKKIEDDCARASAETALIEAALPEAADRFVVHPTLEAEMGIGRNADNKPMRSAARVAAARTRDDPPAQLVAAVRRLHELDPDRESAKPSAGGYEHDP